MVDFALCVKDETTSLCCMGFFPMKSTTSLELSTLDWMPKHHALLSEVPLSIEIIEVNTTQISPNSSSFSILKDSFSIMNNEGSNRGFTLPKQARNPEASRSSRIHAQSSRNASDWNTPF